MVNEADPTFDAVTVNYRSADDVAKLAADLRGAEPEGVRHRLIVVDCSGELAAAPRSDNDMVVIDPGANLGFGAACNLALEQVRAPVTAFLNPDYTPESVGLVRVLRAGCEDEAVAWTGLLRNDDGSVQRNTAPEATLWRLALEYLVGMDTSYPPVQQRRVVRTITGAVLLARTDALRSVGGFDRQFPLYMEDVDLTDRLAKLGAVLQYPVPVGTHVGGGSSRHVRRSTTTLLHASRVRWFARRGRLTSATARLVVIIGCAERWLLRPARRSSIDLVGIWKASGRGFQLDRLLPPRPLS